MEASMNWRLFVPLGLFAAGAVGGYMYASHEYGEEIANVKLQAAIVRANDGRKSYEKLVAAQNALDASRRDAVRLSDDLDRLQRTYKDRERRASADACRVERAAIARCEDLLREGASLAQEGGKLLQRNAGLHDAAVSLKQ